MSIYHYNDYRLFLKNSVSQLQKTNKNLSIREILRRVGISSPSYYKEVILDAKKTMSPAMARKFAWFLKLDKNETEYFMALVGYNQSKTEMDRTEYYEKLIRFVHRESIESKILSVNEYKYISSWEIPALREALQFQKNFGNRNEKERKQLADRFLPKVTEQQVAEAIEILESLGFIKRDSRGNYKGINLNIRSEKTPAAYTFMNQNMRHALAIFNITPAHSRFFKGLTAGISEHAYSLIEKKVKEFSKEIAYIVNSDSHQSDRLYSMGIYFFPLTKLPGENQ
jgi:uncharacterized protein (TIGR02147 family)